MELEPSVGTCSAGVSNETESVAYLVFFGVSLFANLLNVFIHVLGMCTIWKSKKFTNSRLLWFNISIVAILFSLANLIRSVLLYVMLRNIVPGGSAGSFNVNVYNCSNSVLIILKLVFLMFMLYLTVDQMTAGFSPVQYRAKLSFFSCSLLIALAWTGGGVLLFLLIVFYKSSFLRLSGLVFVVLLIAMFIFMVVTYVRLYSLLKKQQVIRCVSSNVRANCNRTVNNANSKLRKLFSTCLIIFVVFTIFFVVPILLYLAIADRISPFEYNIFYIPVLVCGFLLIGVMYMLCQSDLKGNLKHFFTCNRISDKRTSDKRTSEVISNDGTVETNI